MKKNRESLVKMWLCMVIVFGLFDWLASLTGRDALLWWAISAEIILSIGWFTIGLAPSTEQMLTVFQKYHGYNVVMMVIGSAFALMGILGLAGIFIRTEYASSILFGIMTGSLLGLGFVLDWIATWMRFFEIHVLHHR